MADESKARQALASLGDADLEFVLRLALASGSLKELAQAYGVSYPTIRARLDRLLAQLEGTLKGRPPDPVAELLADYLEKGEITSGAARAVLDLHRRELKRIKEQPT